MLQRRVGQEPSYYLHEGAHELSPRFMLYRKTTLSSDERRRRQRTRHVTGYSRYVDHLPEDIMQGSLLDAIVYAELERRNIPFYYQREYHVSIPEAGIERTFRQPDFFIPDQRIIIYPMSSYHHTKEENIQRDALRFALFEHEGWQVEAWWDYDIHHRLHELFEQAGLSPRQDTDPTGGWYRKNIGDTTERDDVAGIRSLNQQRTKYWQQAPTHRGRSGTRRGVGTMSRQVMNG